MEQPDERVRASRMESAAHVASLPRGDSVQMRGRGYFPSPRAARTFLQSYLDVILGAVLVLAGALKGQQLLTDPSAGRASGFPRELLIGASAFELAFGCWLLGGMYRRLDTLASPGLVHQPIGSGAGASNGRHPVVCLPRRVARPSLAHVRVRCRGGRCFGDVESHWLFVRTVLSIGSVLVSAACGWPRQPRGRSFA
jgi:hypothetical protein